MVSSVQSAILLLPFLTVAIYIIVYIHEWDTRKAFLGSW
jgi:hypothetical protein